MVRLTRQQVREIDRRAIAQYHIPGVVLMENAAIAVAEVVYDVLDNNCSGQVLILCGGGNNGGDGLAVARHLHNRGASVRIALTSDPSKYRNEAMVNWQIVQAMNLRTGPADPDQIRQTQALLIIDAIFGTGLAEPPREPFGQIVQAVQDSRLPVLSIDVPSGLDCDTGRPLGPCIRAARTITFVAEKAGFVQSAARPFLGRVTVGDIGCPRQLIDEVIVDIP